MSEEKQLTPAEKETEEIYSRKLSGITKKTIAAFVIGGAVMLGGYADHLYRTLTHSPSKIVSEYKDMNSTLHNLKRKRGSMNYTDVSYEPEKIKSHLEKVLGNEREAKESLDKAIEIVEEDLEKIEQSPEVKNYKDYQNNSIYRLLISMFGGMATMIGSAIWFGLAMDKYKIKKMKALIKLKEERELKG